MTYMMPQKKMPQKKQWNAAKHTLLSFSLLIPGLSNAWGAESCDLTTNNSFTEVRPDYNLQKILQQHREVIEESKEYFKDLPSLYLADKKEFVIKALNNMKRLTDFFRQLKYGSITAERYPYTYWDHEKDSFDPERLVVGIQASRNNNGTIEILPFMNLYQFINVDDDILDEILQPILHKSMMQAMMLKIFSETGYPDFIPSDSKSIEDIKSMELEFNVLNLFYGLKRYLNTKEQIITNLLLHSEKFDENLPKIEKIDLCRKINFGINLNFKPKIKIINSILNENLPTYLEGLKEIQRISYNKVQSLKSEKKLTLLKRQQEVEQERLQHTLNFSRTVLNPLFEKFKVSDICKCLTLFQNYNAKLERIKIYVQHKIINNIGKAVGAENLVEEIRELHPPKAPQRNQPPARTLTPRQELLKKRLEAKKAAQDTQEVKRLARDLIDDIKIATQTHEITTSPQTKTGSQNTKKQKKKKKKAGLQKVTQPVKPNVVTSQPPKAVESTESTPGLQIFKDEYNRTCVVAPVQQVSPTDLMKSVAPAEIKSNHKTNTTAQQPAIHTMQRSMPVVQSYYISPNAPKSKVKAKQPQSKNVIQPKTTTTLPKSHPISVSQQTPQTSQQMSWSGIVKGEVKDNLPQLHEKKQLNTVEPASEAVPEVTSPTEPQTVPSLAMPVNGTQPIITTNTEEVVPPNAAEAIGMNSMNATPYYYPYDALAAYISAPPVTNENDLYRRGCYYPPTTSMIIPNPDLLRIDQIIIQSNTNVLNTHVYYHPVDNTTTEQKPQIEQKPQTETKKTTQRKHRHSL